MRRVIGTVVMAAGLIFFSTGLAQAATLEGADKNIGSLTLEATKKTSIAYDDELCEQAREVDDSAGTCGTQTVLETSQANVVDISKISPTELALKSADGTTLGQAFQYREVKILFNICFFSSNSKSSILALVIISS